MTRHLLRRLAVVGTLLGLVPAAARAQQGTTISGHVTAEGMSPLPGASVSIASLGVGALTDAEGKYSFTVPARGASQSVTITARRIGYLAKTVTLTLSGGSVTQDFSLAATPTQLTGIVVTALGITREKSQLGTAQQQISSAELNTTRTLNLVDQMQGKVSGVQITGSGTQGGSTNIIIRGSNSITGNNQPLFVVDGVPVSNNDRGGSANGAFDYGSAISDINPEDVETMSVLKGPNAAALYGSRAANGVIVITTKKGRNTGARGRVDGSQLFTFDSPSRLWDYQNLYGQGAAGEFQFVDGAGGGVHDDLDQSFGPKLDGRTTGCTHIGNDPSKAYDTSAPCLQFTSPNAASAWVAHPDNVKDFFAAGHTSSTNISAMGGTDRANARISLGSDNTAGIVPNSFFQKTSAILSGNVQLNDKFSSSGTLQYVRNAARDRPGTGYNVGIMESMIWFGRQVDMNALKANYQLPGSTNGGPADREYNWNYNFHNNPFWLQNDNPLTDARDRVIISGSATYKLLDWVNASLTSGSDIYNYNINQDFAHGNLVWADPSFAGGFNQITDYRNENNTQLLFTGSHGIGSRLQFNGTAGGNLRSEQFTSSSVSTSGISVAGIYNVSNAAITPTLGQTLTRRQVNSAFASAAFTLNNWWTVEGTARNDWSSTLPKGANSYFYPSVNTSFVLSDAVPSLKDHGISYLKLRGSVAQVGNDADPYALRSTYVGNSLKFNGLPQFSLSDVIANAQLKPEITNSAEAGAEVGFFDGRVSLDASVYSKATKNQIYNVTISPATGFSSKAINAGEIDNRGVEALLTLVPIRMSNGFEWSTTFNYTHNKSKVASLAQGITAINLGSTWSTFTQARVGDPYGDIYGYPFQRDSATHQLMVINATRPDGLPEGLTTRAPAPVVLGNIQPKWIGSWGNTFNFKNYSLTVNFDARRGGQFFSVSNFWGDYAGITQNSLLGREVDWNNPGYVVNGILKSSCGAGSHADAKGEYVCVGGGKQNTNAATSEDYFQNIYPVVENSIFTDNWVKLRELRFGVELPTRYANRLRVSSANIAFVGRNLWTSTNVPNIDPEFSYSTGNYQGSEFAALPNARSVGVSLRVTP